MFIKKDLRKVPRILQEAASGDNNNNGFDGHNDDDDASADRHRRKRAKTASQPPQATSTSTPAPLIDLKLGRRRQEFGGKLDLLCQPSFVCKWNQLESLSLYDCELSSLDGIGIFRHAPELRTINLGRNPLTSLPDELGELASTLQVLWLDDCQLQVDLPQCIYRLTELRELRLSNNRLTAISPDIRHCRKLESLSLDRNRLERLPPQLRQLDRLRVLSIRQNLFEELGDEIALASLEQLHASSNTFRTIPDSLLRQDCCPRLRRIVMNGNRIVSLPSSMCAESSSLPKNLEQLVLSHNRIASLPASFFARFGLLGADGVCRMEGCTVQLQCNPLTTASEEAPVVVVVEEEGGGGSGGKQ
mmetsp:Transcript_16502/g.46110  ORF Transcript_16502/g.46110 Transcript_16502/m.46110 type:complete len:360 (-) Transcript_16502:179-1258(-)